MKLGVIPEQLPVCLANQTVVVPKPGLCYPICHSHEILAWLSHQSEPSGLLSAELPVCLANETMVMPKPAICYPICHAEEMMWRLVHQSEPTTQVNELDSFSSIVNAVHDIAKGLITDVGRESFFPAVLVETLPDLGSSLCSDVVGLITESPIISAVVFMILALLLHYMRCNKQVRFYPRRPRRGYSRRYSRPRVGLFMVAILLLCLLMGTMKLPVGCLSLMVSLCNHTGWMDEYLMSFFLEKDVHSKGSPRKAELPFQPIRTQGILSDSCFLSENLEYLLGKAAIEIGKFQFFCK